MKVMSLSWSALRCLLYWSVVPLAIMPIKAHSDGNKSQGAPSQSSELSANMHRYSKFYESLEQGANIPVLYHGSRARKEIALTFDDGPHLKYTEELLDLLKKLDVKATFFVVGKMVDRYPDLVMKELADGHEIANHTYDHLNLKKLTPEQVQKEILMGADAIKRVVGYAPVYFRPPGGQYNDKTLRAAAAIHQTPVLWTANSKDFMRPKPDVLERRLLNMPASGGILLCHDGIPETMQILPDLVARLKAQGYVFVTVSELAKHLK